MGYDKNVKFGNYTTIFTTEYGDVLITDYHIKFPNNPNCYYANKKSIEDAACFVVQHYAQLSWPSTIPQLSGHSESISNLSDKCKLYRDRLNMIRDKIQQGKYYYNSSKDLTKQGKAIVLIQELQTI